MRQGLYRSIVVDPPWDVNHAPLPGTEEGVPYPTMTRREIEQLPIQDLVAANAWLFLWCTNQTLYDAPDLIDYWDLEYRGTLVWAKNTKPGTQFGWRMNAEFVVVARNGNPKFSDLNDFAAVNRWPAGKHSQKPDGFYELVERVCGKARRLDMFARSKRRGWTTWGKEA